MNNFEEKIVRSGLPKLDIEIGKFKNKETGEIGFCVMSVKTGLTEYKHNYIYDARFWERVNDINLEGTERIQEAFYDDLIRIMEKRRANYIYKDKNKVKKSE